MVITVAAEDMVPATVVINKSPYSAHKELKRRSAERLFNFGFVYWRESWSINKWLKFFLGVKVLQLLGYSAQEGRPQRTVHDAVVV